MTIENPKCADSNQTDNANARPLDSTPRMPAHSNPLAAIRGLWPGDINDGFEKALREMRDSEMTNEPRPWW
jgi:hypothetical protein